MHILLSSVLFLLHSVYGGAIVSGLSSWFFLNRHTVRGDYACTFYLVVFLCLYLFPRLFPSGAAPVPLSLLLSATATYFASLASATLLYRLSPFHPLAAYPGPVTWRLSSIVLAIVSYGGKRHIILDLLHRKYGRFVRIGPNALSINSPNAGNLIYGAAHHMVKSESYAKPGHVGGVALFFKQDREEHATRKKIWSTAFTGSATDNFFPPLESRTWQLTQCIDRRRDADGSVDLTDCISHWSYDFMGEMVFGGCNNLELMRDGDPEELVLGGKKATAIVDSIGQTPWLMDIIWHLPVGKSLHRLRLVSAVMMRHRVKDTAEVVVRDLSSYLLEGDPHTGERISMSDLEVESLIAIQAGSDNTASSITLCLFFLLTHATAFKTLQAELDTAFPDPTGQLDNGNLARLEFLNAAINESLRLGTPFFLPRIVPEGGVTIDGNFVPEGTIVALAGHSQQISEDNFFPDPQVYRPERWMPGGLGPKSILNKSAMYAFSSGPYVCIAKSFAIQEMRLVIARLVLTFDMRLPPKFDPSEFFEGFRNMRTTMFDKPLLVQAVRRPGKSPADI